MQGSAMVAKIIVMADIFPADKRSDIMSRIHSKNTKAELVVFRYLRKNKVYFQKHYDRALGKPDVALPRRKKAVFIDSDFWHGKTFDDIKRRYAADSYWVKKIARNIQRDKEQRATLKKNGWVLLVVWENDILRKATRDDTLTKVKDFLAK
jgi:DNA mismatch endonuclease, patch repair protein